MSSIRFHKVHGAGNDFVLLDARRGGPKRPARARIRALLDRRYGVGGDGLLYLESTSERNTVRVRYWNADGSSAAFCGNGARCAADQVLGSRPRDEVRLRFGRRVYLARRSGPGRIRVAHPEPRLLPIPGSTPLRPLDPSPAGADSDAAWIDSGVPHLVLPVENAARAPLERLGPQLRSRPSFGPGGTNVDLIQETRRGWLVRTWERGVEGETEACGSGLLAAGYYAARILGRGLPLRLWSRGGYLFVLDEDPEGGQLWLEGPAERVYSGLLPHGYPAGRAGRRDSQPERRDRCSKGCP